VFLTVHRRLPQFAGRCSIENWVFGILLRVVRNHRRTRRRKGMAHAISTIVSDPDELVGHDDPMETVSLREALGMLQNVLSRLKQRHARLWAMAKIDELSPAEIAEQTGLSVFTVYSRLKAARNELDREVSRQKLATLGRTGFRAFAVARPSSATGARV
jgi:RNA polymerase sigma-70 factor (ECF subfamily)